MKALSLTVAPTSLREYATARGWVQLREALKDGLVVLNHEKYKPKQIVYPTNSGDPGYLDSVGIALARLAELEGKQISELVSDVRRVHEDTYRFRLFDDRKVREGCEEAQRPPMSYAMSKDYEALYDHLCNGGEALAAVIYTGQEKGAKWLRAPELHTSTSLSRSINFGGIYVSEHGDHRAEFITSCTRLNLEWLAPAQPLSAQQVFDVVEEFIKQEAERVGTDQPTGLEYPVGHRHWNNMIADLRERLNKLIG